MKKLLKWIGIIFFGLFVLGTIVNMFKSPEEKAAEQAASQKQASQEQAENDANAAEKQAKQAAMLAALPEVTAEQLAIDYDENTVAADQKYKDKQFKVAGKVTDINTDFMGQPYLTMGGSNEFMRPQFAFDKDAADQLAKVKKGMKLTLLCKGKGDVAKIPMSDNCQII